jgi:hypothetical protein
LWDDVDRAYAPSICIIICWCARGRELPTTAVIQETQASVQDPLPGHEGHQIVLALPPSEDGQVWLGKASWVASKPVEVVVLHGYNGIAVSN